MVADTRLSLCVCARRGDGGLAAGRTPRLPRARQRRAAPGISAGEGRHNGPAVDEALWARHAKPRQYFVYLNVHFSRPYWVGISPEISMMGSHMPGTPILPLRTSTIEEVLACVAWVQRRNHGAYLAHRKQREAEG